MPEPPCPTHGAAFVVAETRAAAYQLRAMAARLLALVWLERAGFELGRQCEVEVGAGTLTIWAV